MKRLLHILLFLIWVSMIDAFSQQVHSTSSSDQSVHTVDVDSLLPTPSMDYFQKSFSLNRDYHYEIENRLKALKLRKQEIESIKFLVCFLSFYGGTFLLYDGENDGALTWIIPASMAVAAGEYLLFTRWQKSIQKKIDIIQSSRIYSYAINRNVELEAVSLSSKISPDQPACGVTLKIKW